MWTRLYRVLFSTKPELPPSNFWHAADPSYYWLYPSKQVVDHFMLFVRFYCVLFSHLECSVEQVLAADLSAHTAGTGRLLITMTNNLKSPTNTTMTARLLYWIAHGQVRWAGNRLNKFYWAIQILTCVLTTQFADSAWSHNITSLKLVMLYMYMH